MATERGMARMTPFSGVLIPDESWQHSSSEGLSEEPTLKKNNSEFLMDLWNLRLL